ncbi:hypothetical protein P2318_25105 [Myxococcaceae bacterium GXIMD 01537]
MKKLLLTAVLTLASTSLADIAPPDSEPCINAKVGAACTKDDGAPGTCQEAKCTRNDYSQGVPPRAVEYDCLKCAAAQATPDAASPATASTPEKKSGSCAAMPGAPLALGALWAGWLARRRTRAA